MHTKICPGMIVYIENLSKPSYYLYKSYLKHSPLLRCPCIFKKGNELFEVEEVYGTIAILKCVDKDILTMTYVSDLKPLYEDSLH